MQPYLFPYMGYWQLIANSDKFIFFDVVQYNKRSWMNRNRILHPDQPDQFQYIIAPISKHNNGTLIKDIVINNDEKWKDKILGQLTVYKKLKAPFYNDTIELIQRILEQDYQSFLDLSVKSTKMICEHIGIDLKYDLASNIEFDRKMVKSPGDWALAICNKLEVKNYINPYGGYEIFDEKKYNDDGVDIKFLKSKLSPYKQSWRKEFMVGLSIIDVLMFNSRESVVDILKNNFQIMVKKDLEGIH